MTGHDWASVGTAGIIATPLKAENPQKVEDSTPTHQLCLFALLVPKGTGQPHMR